MDVKHGPISEALKEQLEAAEMWFLRRMMKISWIKKVTNEDASRRAQTERKLMKQIVKRRCSFLGHIVRKEGVTLVGSFIWNHSRQL